MSRSPLGSVPDPGNTYIKSFQDLAYRIRAGASFSGRERNCAFLNLGGESFADASAALGLDLEQDARGLAVCDWDHDGDLDLWLTNRTAPRLQLMQNRSAAGERHSVAFLLVGDPAKACPMDAAGARCSVSAGGVTQTQTVHFGDGFLSQSSRWLHFGLGEKPAVNRVTVHWPAGSAELFSVAPGARRFVLKQGEGVAKPAEGELPNVLLPAPLQLPAPTEIARIWLSQPVSSEALSALPELPEGPVLLNLWASWCVPCLAELKSFAQAGDLPVVPINIENIGETKISTEKADAILRAAGIEVATRFADWALIETLNGLVKESIYRHRNLPVPASFLLDADRKLRAIYMGPVDPVVVRADIARLDEEEPDGTLPFPGRWCTGAFKTNPMAVVDTYINGGYVDDARAYASKYLEIVGSDPGGALRVADLYLKLGDIERAAGEHAMALERYKKAVAANPKLISAEIHIVLLLAELGRGEEALARVSELQESAVGNPNFINLEADVRRVIGEDATAVAKYREVISINSRYIPAIVEVAALLARSGDRAVRDGVEAVRLAEFLSGAPGARENAEFVTILADAYAASGEYQKALAAAQRAQNLVRRYGGDEVLDALERRVELFKQEKSFDGRSE